MAQDPLKAALAVLDEPESKPDPLAAALAVLDEPEPQPAAKPQYAIPVSGTSLPHATAYDAGQEGAGQPNPAMEAARSVGRGAAQAGISIAQSPLLGHEALGRATHTQGGLAEAIWDKLLGYAPDESGRGAGRRAAESLEKTKAGVLPARGERGFATHTAPEALGSALTFMLGGALTGGGALGIAGTGAAVGFADGFFDATAHGATEEEAWTSAALNAGLGLPEALPLGKFLARFNRGTGGSLRTALVRMLTEGGEEMAQEVAQGIGTNIVAKSLYDDERELLRGLKEGGAAGFFVGALLSAGASGMARSRALAKATERATTDKQASPEIGTEGFAGPIERTDPGIAGPIEQEGPGATAPMGAAVDTSSGALLPAEMPTDPGLFGEVEREAGVQAPEVQAPTATPSMFDEQPGDLPGQASILDVPEVRPERQQLTRGQKAEAATRARRVGQEVKALSGEGTLRDFIAAQGGLEYSEEAWMRFSRRESGERQPVGTPQPVRPRGKGGMTVAQAAQIAAQEGFFPGEDFRDIGLNQLLDAMESGVTPHNADAIAAKMQEDYFREQESRAVTPSEIVSEVERTVSTMNRKMDAEMAALGMDPGTRAERTTEKAWDDAAAARMAADPFAGQKLLGELRSKPRPPTGEETALLTRELVRMSLERDRINQEIITAYEAGNDDLAEALEERAGKVSEEWGSAADVIAHAGSESGRSLRARQMMMALDYSLVAMERAKRAANKGEPLTPEQSKEILDLHNEIKALQEKVAKQEASSDERVRLLEEQIDTLIKAKSKERRKARAKAAVDGPVVSYISAKANEARARIKARGMQMSAGFDPQQWADHIIVGAEYIARDIADLTAWSKKMVSEFGDAIEPHLKAIFKLSSESVPTLTAEARRDAIAKNIESVRDAAPQVRKLTESFIESGITEREPLIDAVHGVLVTLDESITRRETMDLMSGYGNFKPLSESETKARLRDLRGEMQQLAKLDDMLSKGQIPKASGPERAKLSDEGRRILTLVNEKMREMELEGGEGKRLKTALDSYKTRTENEIKSLQEKIKAKDFAPKRKPKPLRLDDEATDLKAQLEQAKRKYLKGLEEDRRSKMTAGQKVGMVAADALNVPRQLWSSYDLSAFGRQGLVFSTSHPAKAARILAISLKALKSEQKHQQIDAAIREEPRPGLYIADLDAKLSMREEAIRSNLAEKIPLIGKHLRASNRAYVTALNLMRVQLYDQMTAAANAEPGSDRARSIAAFANIATGRGEAGKFAAHANAANAVLWSTRLYLSRLQLLTGYPLWAKGADGPARKQMAKELGRSIVGLTALYAAVRMFTQSLIADDDEEVEIVDDPRSSDFGKVRIGNTRIDPMGGILQFAVLASRIASGETMTLKGEERDLRHYKEGDKDPVGFGGDDVASVAGRFIRGKLNPTLGLALDFATGEDVVGDPVPHPVKEPLKALGKVVAPMSIQGLVEAIEEHGVPRGAALGILSALGMGVSVYGDKK